MTIRDDFEKTPTGNRPRIAQAHIEGHGDLIEVTAERAAAGKQCLLVKDALGLKFSYDSLSIENQ